MGTYTKGDVLAYAWLLLKDEGDTADQQLVPDSQLETLLAGALAIYGQVRPVESVEDLPYIAPGTTTALPSAWSPGFSRILSVESPIGSVPPEMMDERDWRLYRTPSGQSIMWLGTVPQEDVRVTFTTIPVYGTAAADTTVPDADHHAVGALLASLAAEAIANHYAQTSEQPVFGTDGANYGSKAQQWGSAAGRLRRIYERAIGAAEDSLPVASGWVNWDTPASDGGDYLFHGKARR